jgi:O-antigen ligase
VVVLAVVGAIALVGSLQRNAGNDYEGGFNTSGRRQAWDFFLGVGDRHPWSGNGLGASAVATATEAPAGVQTAFVAPHNEYIHLYVDLGWLLGAVVLGAVALLLGYVARRAAGALEALGLLAGTAVLALLDNPLSTASIPLLLALLVGVYRNSVEREDHDRVGRRTRPHRRLDQAARHGPPARPERVAVARGGRGELPG